MTTKPKKNKNAIKTNNTIYTRQSTPRHHTKNIVRCFEWFVWRIDRLNAASEEKFVDCGRLFHAFITRWAKNRLRILVQCDVYNLHGWPLVVDILKNPQNLNEPDQKRFCSTKLSQCAISAIQGCVDVAAGAALNILRVWDQRVSL